MHSVYFKTRNHITKPEKYKAPFLSQTRHLGAKRRTHVFLYISHAVFPQLTHLEQKNKFGLLLARY